MSLPKIKYPVTEITVPSTGKVINFRPFLVREEKILLMAQQSGSKKEILKAVKQIINNCSVDEIDVQKLLIVDIEYLFLQLRAISVNNIVKVSFTDGEDKKVYSFDIDLTAIAIKKPKKKVSNKIQINDKVGMILKQADGEIIDNLVDIDNEGNLLMFYIRNCIKEIFDEESVYDVKESSDEELNEFIDNLPSSSLEKIKDFFASAATMEHTIAYTNNMGTERKIVLKTLDDFFQLL